MIVKKGGISRNIDERRLPEYQRKGYKVASAKEAKKDEAPTLDDMTVAQLKEYAAAHAISIEGVTAKADILAAIKAAE